MAKRPRFSRWRRLPPVFRTGEHRPIGTGNELDRIILYLPARALDLAEALAEKDRQKVIEIEARRGPLEGLKQIAADPDYLAEWQAESESRPAPRPPVASDIIAVDFVLADAAGTAAAPASESEGVQWIEEATEDDRPVLPGEPAPRTGPRPVAPAVLAQPMLEVITNRTALEVLWRHVGLDGDQWAFLPCLRRGVSVPGARSAELLTALKQLETEHRGTEVLDRRMAHALHRLALESQVLLTDAWPGVFDGPMIATIRTVQEAVERILSGQDIRY